MQLSHRPTGVCMQPAVLVLCTPAVTFLAAAGSRTASAPPAASRPAVAIDPAAAAARPGRLCGRYRPPQYRSEESRNSVGDRPAKPGVPPAGSKRPHASKRWRPGRAALVATSTRAPAGRIRPQWALAGIFRSNHNTRFEIERVHAHWARDRVGPDIRQFIHS